MVAIDCISAIFAREPLVNDMSKIWPAITLVLLFAGYAGYYFCRTNLALAKTSLAAEFSDQGINEKTITNIASTGLVFYAVGKLITGATCDFVGGRIMFIGGMFGSVACTFLFIAAPTLAAKVGAGSLFWIFLTAACLNRFIQSTGWGALVKVTSNWFSFENYGRVMGFLCVSYLFGDFAARQVLAHFMEDGGGWQQMFAVSGEILLAIAVLCVIGLRSRPSDVGLAIPVVNPLNLYGTKGAEERPPNLWELLKPYIFSPSFWLVLLMSVTLTFVRESSNFFNNDYLKVAAQVSDKQAAIYSSYFPLFGAFAVLATGYMTDTLYKGRRGLLMSGSLALLLPVIWAMAFLASIEGTLWPVVLVCFLGFLSLAPYAFLTGAIALDLGGKRGSATAAGILDAVGYALGGVLGLEIKSHIVPAGATSIVVWQPFFTLMLGLITITSLACVAYWFIQERQPREVFEVEAVTE